MDSRREVAVHRTRHLLGLAENEIGAWEQRDGAASWKHEKQTGDDEDGERGQGPGP